MPLPSLRNPYKSILANISSPRSQKPRKKSTMIVKRIEDGTQMPYRPLRDEIATLQLHPVPARGLIVKVTPPREPSTSLEHVPCDLVLAIDVSGSMTADAPVPTKPGEEAESTGLSVLDLVKHAARTIVETLNENDRLGIVTFSSTSTVLQKLLPMTAENKAKTDEKIESMVPQDATNLWHGIRDGLKLFDEDRTSRIHTRIPALMVLTDGCPNHMCPVQGYVPKLRGMGELPAIINTFGFGYSLRSGLLKSIAEVSGGSYAFIPDAGMVGTVFVHAVANLQSTFAQMAVLQVTYPSNLVEPSPRADQARSVELSASHLGPDYRVLTINLHNLQYGQSRDIFLEYSDSTKATSPITVTLTYQRLKQPPEASPPATLVASDPFADRIYTPGEEAYHISRSKLVSFLLSLSPPSTHDEERTPQIPLPEEVQTQLADLKSFFLSSNPDPSDQLNKSLLEDLNGQISLAVTNADYYARWGVHYLPSLADAHAKQACNSFKDPGPLRYGASSPLFVKCRDRLDKAFDDLPPPRPSNTATWINGPGKRRTGGPSSIVDVWGNGVGAVPVRERHRRAPAKKARSGSLRSTTDGAATSCASSNDGEETGYTMFSMSSYNSSDNPCFAGCVRVLLAGSSEQERGEGKGKRPLTPNRELDLDLDLLGNEMECDEFPWLEEQSSSGNTTGGRTTKISKLRAGMRVQTPRGPRRVVAVLKTAVRQQEMCLVGKKGLLVTPWHPVALPVAGTPSSTSWTFPRDIARRKVRYTGSIYSVLLERDGDPAAHALFVGGVWGVTLGHGLVSRNNTGAGGNQVDVRAHSFFGDYTAVVRALERLHRNSSGLVLGGGVKRDEKTGLVDGFRRLSGEEMRRVVDEMTSGGNGSRTANGSRSKESASTGAARHATSSRAETCMWRRTVGCV